MTLWANDMMAETSKSSFETAGLERLTSSLENGSGSDPKALQEAIELFNRHTEELRVAYDALRARVASVDRELEEKNRHLAQQVHEIERLKGDLDEIIESMDNGLIAADTEGIITTFNKAAEGAFGLNRDEILGLHLSDVLKRGGRTITRALTDGRSQGLEITAARTDGRTVYLRGSVNPLLDREGAPRGAAYIFTDLTSQRLLEERARRADRMTALGELAAGVAHEMRNPLTTIRGYLQALPDFKDDAGFIEEFSENLIREIDRLTRLTNDMLDMAKPVSNNLKLTDLGDIADSVLAFLSERAREGGVTYALNRDANGSPVKVDPDRVKQILINLVVNAIEACGSGGGISVDLRRGEEQVDESGYKRTFVTISVEDNGPGVPADRIDRLFDPFFTTKSSGTGLGLALSSRIAEEHEGLLRVESEEGEGTTFHLLLPLAEESPSCE